MTSTLKAEPYPDNSPLVLHLKWFHQFQFAGYYTALEKGFYAEEGLNVVIEPRNINSSPVEEILNNNAQFGVADSSLVLSRLNNKPVVALAAFLQHSPLILLSLKEKAINTPKDLIGKRIMYQRNTDDAQIMAMLYQQGISEKDFTYIAHNFDNDALLSGRIDVMAGYLSHQPYYYQNAGYAVSIINPNNYGIDFYGDLLFTSQHIMEQHPETALAFRRASIKGWRYAIQNTEEVISWLIDKYPASATTTVDQLRQEATIIKQMIQHPLIPIGNIDANRFSYIASIYKARELTQANSQLEGFIYTDYSTSKSPSGSIIALFFLVAGTIIGMILFFIFKYRQRIPTATLTHSNNFKNIENIEHYLHIIDSYTMAIQVDKNCCFQHVSEAFCHASGYTKHELLGQSHFEVIAANDTHSALFQELLTTIQRGQSWHGNLNLKTKFGLSYTIQGNVVPNLDSAGNFNGYSAIGFDITDKKIIEELAIKDPLTGLYNRIKTDKTLSLELKRISRTNGSLSLIILDIDNFKAINDNYGHQAGDSVLIELATLIKTSIRESDIAGRWGGEEFLLLCPETNIIGAINLAEKIRQTISSYNFKIVNNVTASFGVSNYRQADTEYTLIERADKAMYQAKNNGRNCVINGDAHVTTKNSNH